MDRHALALWACLIGLAGCGEDDATVYEEGSRADTVFASLVTSIGEIDGAEEYTFGDISSVVIDGGHMYVADRVGSTVRAYDSTGRFVGQIGAEGRGPGEFVWPEDLSVDPDGRLYVRDIYRITLFAASSVDGVADSLVGMIPYGGGGGSVRSRTDGKLYYYPGAHYGDAHRYFYLVLDTTGVVLDTIHVPSFETSAYIPSAIARIGTDALMLRGINRAPFEPVASWDITTSGTVIATPGDRYEVRALGAAGDTSWILRRPEAPRPLTAAEARDSARALRNRLDSVPVPLDRVLRMSESARQGRVPSMVPAIIAAHTAGEQTWLRRWPPSDDSNVTIFDVLGAGGAFLHTVVIPAPILQNPAPSVSSSRLAGVVRDSSTGIQRVSIFRLPRR